MSEMISYKIAGEGEIKKKIFDRSYKISVTVAALWMLGSLVANYFASTYATNHVSNSVSDLILNLLPVVNVTPIFVYGFVAFCVSVVILIISDPHKIPFAFKTIALFIAIRSIFVMLTHLAPYPEIKVDFADFNFILRRLVFSGDLFFSAHAGLPFLMALLYWHKKYLRYIFLVCSGIFGATVLLGHLHYSIDVFAAFFITDGIFRLASFFFKKDLAYFNRNKKITA
jgi:hypothetical protein